MKLWSQKLGIGVQKLKIKLWFGEVQNGKVTRSNDLRLSFLKATNPEPLPFNLVDVGIEIFGNAKNYYQTLRKTAIQVMEEVTKSELKKEDKYIVTLVKTLEDIDEAINMLKERLKDLEGIKENYLTELFENKIGELKELRRKVDLEIDSTTSKLAPNLSEIAGSKIAAKLIERTGGLEKLMKMPASKIQLIGAEKSLYKALARLRKGKKAKIPKHGVIFLHPFVRSLPKSKRGKMARFLAAKIAIAAKIDYFRGELEESLYESVRYRYENLRRE